MKTPVNPQRNEIKPRDLLLLVVLLILTPWPIWVLSQPVSESLIGVTSLSEWELVRSDDQIDLYIRVIKMEGYPEGRQLGITFRMRGDVSTAIELISNSQLASRWMSSIKSFQILKNKGDACWYSYMLYDIPWPLRKQDLIAVNRLHTEPDGSRASIEMRSEADFLPENKGITRIQHMVGTWHFTQEPGNQVAVSYTIYSGQKSSFPRWITDPIIQGNMIRTMGNFRKLGEEQFYSKKSITRNN